MTEREHMWVNCLYIQSNKTPVTVEGKALIVLVKYVHIEHTLTPNITLFVKVFKVFSFIVIAHESCLVRASVESQCFHQLMLHFPRVFL